MNKKNLKLFLFIFLLSIFTQKYNCAYAGYDVIKATTVSNINDESDNKEEQNSSVPTFNDPQLPNFSEENSITEKIGKKTSSFFSRKRKGNKSENIEEETETESESESESNNITPVNNEEDISDSNKFIINADKISYDETDGNVYATGNVEIIADVQGIKLKSDEAVLDKDEQTLKMSKNVKIIKNGAEMTGEYLLVNLNEQNILMDNPSLSAYQFIIKAQEAFLIENNIQMLNGTLSSESQRDFYLETRGFQKYEDVSLDYRTQRAKDRKIESNIKQVYDVKSKEIVLTSYKDHNSILLKKSDIYYNKHKIVTNSDIEIISDKKNSITEINAPEAGNFRNFGMYVGYGMVFKLPKGQLLKFMPALTYGHNNIGVGAIVRHRSQNNLLEAGYNTSTTNLVLSGKYRFGHGVSLSYGRNAYMPEGFLGARRSGYAAQLQYEKSYMVDDLNLRFNHAFYAGAFSDYVKHKQESHAYATSRFRYIAEIRKDLFKYKNKEQDFSVRVGSLAQGAATVYGSGETAGVVRIGPFLTTNLRKWESSVGYMLAGIHGDSPFVFDKYRYGKSSFMFNEKFNFNNKFALGFKATISPEKDNYERDLLTESRLYAIVGPQDLKFCLSYDFVRDIAHIDLMFLVGTDSSKIHFDKLTTKDVDKKNKKDFYKSKPVKIIVPENI